MAKRIKDANGLVLGWNRKKNNVFDRTMFIKYKDIIQSQPVGLVDFPRVLFTAMKEIERLEKSNETRYTLNWRNGNWEKADRK